MVQWAEWLEAIGTVLAFGATSVVIFRDHRLREKERRERALDDALRVVATAGPSGDYTTKPGEAVTVVLVTVANNGRRAIRDVSILVETLGGRKVGTAVVPLIQSGWHDSRTFPADDDVWRRVGGSSGVVVNLTVTFLDTLETRWTLLPDGELVAAPMR